ncbi:hypothetical protein PILCRDRAFT_815824 [Piloderma croceum F 1598]|uniref:VHS domain-containing protein n=1 Tax=Piloderma croceum (strain F 1598) TaxID=765440 RepID=A0A0C3BJS1_PILCF|nr:hypothetical protein PILCRDRAFT_815824 [Piloderma croceum F 1598]
MLGNPTSWINVSQIEILVTRACDPSLHEPNYALHLEVAEYINSKKANTPREACMLVARYANHRNPHIAILALSLLDTLVQSCGYPLHLQISTKEFLNELVRRFPERPPPFPGPVMSRILDLIHDWREGICASSRWKDDLANIRDMHRLLTFKGYRFREVPSRRDNLEVASNIKSAEELESEDREAQSAKLQELIRRGTPRDLAAAQELMKALAGANPDAKPDYRSQALTELNKLEQKVILLNEMLDNADVERGEKFVSGDVYDQVATILKSARPKIQKWISDAETEDSESLDTFLQINDQINTVLNRYEAFQKGDYSFSSNPIPAELGGSSAKNDSSLIDLDDSAPSVGGLTGGVDDLASLFGSALPTSSVSPPPLPPGVNNATRPPISSHTYSPQQQPQFGSIMLPGTPKPESARASRAGSPNSFGNANGARSGMGMNNASMGMGMGSTSPQQQIPQPPQQQAGSSTSSINQAPGKDPFADLVGLF